MVYGDFEFCLVEVIPDPARLRRWRDLVSEIFRQTDRSSGTGHGSYPGVLRRLWRMGRPGVFAATWVLRLEVSISCAGSRRTAPGWCGGVRWRAWLAPLPEGLDDGHAPAAAGTGWEPIECLWHFDGLRRRCHRKQFTGSRYIGLACGTGEQAVMANAVEAMWQTWTGSGG